jgi:hypothetical protein
VLQAARTDACVLAIGVDTDASGFREASRRAAAPARKGGLPNAVFLVGDASTALAALRQVDEVRVTLPWGSLLRSVLDGDRGFVLAVVGSL